MQSLLSDTSHSNREVANTLRQAQKQLFRDIVRVAFKSKHVIIPSLKLFIHQRNAMRRRNKWNAKGIPVPSFMIVSITNTCNLHCKGCYAHAHQRSGGSEMQSSVLLRLVRESQQLGISILLLAGGEPFLYNELLSITALFPKILFPVFTNGLPLNQSHIEDLKKQRHVVPVISLEGFKESTDKRRGEGVYKRVSACIDLLSRNTIFFGISLTITRNNFQLLTSNTFIRSFMHKGCRLFFFIEYIPISSGTENLQLTNSQRTHIVELMELFRKKYTALFIAFPGDEEKFGGCLSSGRGFIHINARGDIEPCPMAPYSDISLRDVSLKEALQSKLLAAIRRSPERLAETSGGCALWEHRQWVQSLVESTKTDNK